MSLAHLSHRRLPRIAWRARSGRCAVLSMIAVLAAITCEPPRFALAQGDASIDLSALSDNWRRTSAGWQQLPPVAQTSATFAPSQHATLAQLWPAAWAACMILSIASLPASKRPA